MFKKRHQIQKFRLVFLYYCMYNYIVSEVL